MISLCEAEERTMKKNKKRNKKIHNNNNNTYIYVCIDIVITIFLIGKWTKGKKTFTICSLNLACGQSSSYHPKSCDLFPFCVCLLAYIMKEEHPQGFFFFAFVPKKSTPFFSLREPHVDIEYNPREKKYGTI